MLEREKKKKKKKTGQNNGCMPVLSPGGWPASADNLLRREHGMLLMAASPMPGCWLVHAIAS
jgi:hypothetical protein